MFELDLQIREVFVAHERLLLDGDVESIMMTHRFDRVDMLLRSITNLSITHSTKSAIHLVTRHFHIVSFHDYHLRPICPTVGIAWCLIPDKKLWVWIATESQTTRSRT